MPFFAATPVALGGSETLTKESYEFATSSFPAATSDQDATATLRVDLDHRTADPSKAPVGVTGAMIRADTNSFSEKFQSVVVEGGTVKLLDWQGLVPVSFARTAPGTASVGTATCGGGAPYLQGCPFFNDFKGEPVLTLTDSDGPTLTVIN
ncbi:MAG: hypothetical protein FJ096_15870 [Deltaproteobacteria bacterium]|nr:hypothetical protein [Deltaproteobacteria bacterium]